MLLFTGVIALPALFLTPGDTIFTIGGGSFRVTAQGVTAALLLIPAWKLQLPSPPFWFSALPGCTF